MAQQGIKDIVISRVIRIHNRFLRNKFEEKTEMFFGEMAPPPNRGVACLNFRYKKFQTGELLLVL